jgi:flagellar FliJ protein
MKFRFGLEKVLQHRKIVEDLAQRDFQEAQAALHLEIQKLEDMNRAVVSARAEAYRLQSEGGKNTTPALGQIDDFIQGQDLRKENQKKKIKECESLVESYREILRQRAIESKIMIELKDKKKTEFQVEQKKREQKFVDEMNVMRFRKEENKT